MFGMQTASGVRKLLVRQIRCKAQTLLKRLQTWSLASFKLGRILDPENTVTKSFSTLSAQTGPAESARERNGSFRRWKRGTGRWGKPQPQPTGALGASSMLLERVSAGTLATAPHTYDAFTRSHFAPPCRVYSSWCRSRSNEATITLD